MTQAKKSESSVMTGVYLKNRAILFLFIFFILIFSGCSKTPKLEFCVKPAEGEDAVECGTVFTTGELVIRQKLPSKQEKMELYFYDTEDESGAPLDIIPVKADESGEMLKYEIELYDEGKYRFELIGDSGKIGEGILTIMDRRSGGEEE